MIRRHSVAWIRGWGAIYEQAQAFKACTASPSRLSLLTFVVNNPVFRDVFNLQRCNSESILNKL
jgi:hypothetical protein